LLTAYLALGNRLLVGSISILAVWTLACGQDITPGTRREELTRPAKTSKPSSTEGTRTRTVYITKNAHPTITTGTLSVVALPNAIVRLEPVKGGEALEGKVPATEKLFIFPPLKPGVYRVTAALDGHKPAAQNIQIVANKNKGLTLDLEAILYTIRITTNVTSGEVRYAPVAAYTEAGEKKYKAIGETRLALIENRAAVLPALSKGTYGVDIRASEPGYEDRLASITVPDDSNKEEISLEVGLKNVRSTETFSGTTNDQWDLPAGWRIASYVLSTNGKGIAIPHNESNRHYGDFQLISDAKMLNGVAVSFVMRASATMDKYYLVQLTGANADEPFLLSGYVVTNGARERLQSASIAHLKSTINQDQFFKISIKVKDNTFEVSVADSQTGEYFPLGVLVDPNRRFPIGAIGIYAEGKEQNQFGSFIVCTPVCPKQ
jgi:hypothetical protein